MRIHSSDLSIINRLVVLVISILLCWKLFRLISPSPVFWGLHLYVLAIILIVSCVVMILRTNLYNSGSNTSLPNTSLLFIAFAFVAIVRSLIFNSFYDVFFVATIAFGSYFLFLILVTLQLQQMQMQ